MYAKTESSTVRQALRRLPLLATLAAGPALAEPISADVAELLKSMQVRLDRLTARNAELERRLAQQPAQPAAPQAEAALAARVADMDHALITGALDQLIRHQLTGCQKAAHQAVRLLDALADDPDVDGETRALCESLCQRMSATLETRDV